MADKSLEQQIKEIFDIEDYATRFDALRKITIEMEASCTTPQELAEISLTFGMAVHEYMMKDPGFISFSMQHKMSEIKAQKVLPTRTVH